MSKRVALTRVTNNKPIKIFVDHIVCYYEGAEGTTRVELSNDRQHVVKETEAEVDTLICQSLSTE
jgi:hypothetical protein